VPKFDKPEYIPLRGSMFVICGLLGGIPMVHIKMILDPKYLDEFMAFPWAIGGALYILGAIIYMLKIPERLKPRVFDFIVSDKY
jgi:adiponectin receptor